MDKSLEEHFTENIFTGHKDTDRLILLNLNGKDLLSFCSSTPYLNSLCNEELFKNKIRNTSLQEVKDNYPFFINYRKFYAIIMYYISLLKRRYNFNYDLNTGSQSHNATGDPKNQYRLFNSYESCELLSQASASGELQIVKYLVEHGAD